MTVPNDFTKAAITIFNVIILAGLPVFCIWHARTIRYFNTWSFRWWMQIFTVLLYVAAINCEIPAFWSRLIAYYQYHMVLDPVFYALTTWDRWGRVLFYCMFILFTWMQTKQHVPHIVKNTIG